MTKELYHILKRITLPKRNETSTFFRSGSRNLQVAPREVVDSSSTFGYTQPKGCDYRNFGRNVVLPQRNETRTLFGSGSRNLQVATREVVDSSSTFGYTQPKGCDYRNFGRNVVLPQRNETRTSPIAKRIIQRLKIWLRLFIK